MSRDMFDDAPQPETVSGASAQRLDPRSVNQAQSRSVRDGGGGLVHTQSLSDRSPVEIEAEAAAARTALQGHHQAPAEDEAAAPAPAPAQPGFMSRPRPQASHAADEEEGGFRQLETPGAFPAIRLRRNRRTDWLRRMAAENHLTTDDLIWPVFVQAGNGATQVDQMPGVVRYGPDTLLAAVNEAMELGIPAIAIFPEVDSSLKDPACTEAVNPENLVCQSVRRIKETFGDIGVICDVALDPYNSLGHDGLVNVRGDGSAEIMNDETLEVLVQQARVQADAGADILAPSDMMDGRVGVIRQALDDVGHDQAAIMSYAAKYASAFYGPFRSAIGSEGVLKGDKKSYQLNPANINEALREVELDIAEGADSVIVKPGLPYLDVVRAVKERFEVPTYAYQVSGEYAMLAAAAQNGWINGNAVMLETLLSFKRAGADGIWTYAALDVARSLTA